MASSLYRATVDFFFTIVWMSAASSTGVLVKLLLPFLGFDRSMFFPVLLGCIAIQIMIFGVLIAKLRGASFNPTTNLANFWAKEGFESAESLLYRVPAQTLGGLFGALLTWYITPEAYKPMLNGPHVKSHMTIASAAAIEFVLTLALSFIILCIVFKGPKAGPAKGALVAISTVTCIVLGAPHTGPSLNPIFVSAASSSSIERDSDGFIC
eukprot:TRINITY_DN214_c0_g1_i5.p1 TRINITY_DN214_c0_g1~~TRINITY_DN214_c0_g1_i5.p1  ORF type:complete len:210 (+),score=51.32 TRINITY_DN214_c0_g1_i5:113-742(+)